VAADELIRTALPFLALVCGADFRFVTGFAKAFDRAEFLMSTFFADFLEVTEGRGLAGDFSLVSWRRIAFGACRAASGVDFRGAAPATLGERASFGCEDLGFGEGLD